MSEFMTIEAHGDVALVSADRPPANAMNPEFLAEVIGVLDDLSADPPGAVVLTGRPGYFSAGVDLKIAPTLTAEQQGGMVAGINRMAIGWYSFPRPVVAAVEGHAIAGGLVLAMAADYRVVGPSGKLGLTELRAGIPYPAAALGVCAAELAPPVTRRLVLGAELFDPAQALEWSVVDEIAPEGQVVERALEVATDLASTPQATYARIKEQLRGARTAELEAAAAADPLLDGWLSSETAAAAASRLA